MASVQAVRDAIKTRLETIDGLEVHDTVPDSLNPPAAVVAPSTGQFVQFDTGAGTDDLSFMIRVFVSRASLATGQDSIDAYLAGSGSSSVRAAVNGDLDDTAHFAVVTGASNYGTFDVAGVEYLGCDFAVTVGVLA